MGVEAAKAVGQLVTECEKASKVAEESRTIGNFLDWLMNERQPSVVLAVWEDYEDLDDTVLCPIIEGNSIEKLLAEYFGIDLNKMEKEKKALLEGLRVKEKKT